MPLDEHPGRAGVILSGLPNQIAGRGAPARSSEVSGDVGDLFSAAEREIGVLVYAALFLSEDAGIQKILNKAAAGGHARGSRREGRPFGDLSVRPDICNPKTAGSPAAGSQKGSQRRQAVTDAGRRPAAIGAGRWLNRRR